MVKNIEATDLDEYITTDFETSLLIMKEISRIVAEENMAELMKAVALKLQSVGVDFSKADISKFEI